MAMTAESGAPFDLPSLSPLSLQVRRTAGEVVGRPAELRAIGEEIASAKAGRLTALTLEGEPGIGKTRLLTTAKDMAIAEGFMAVAVTADEEIKGPFLLARAIFACARQQSSGTPAESALQRVTEAISGSDDPGLETLASDTKLLRVFDFAAVAIRAAASAKPLALLVDDLQWGDEDSVRLLRYGVRANADLPIFMLLAVRPEEAAVVTELTNLIADMQRMGLVRRLSLGRFSQTEAAALLEQTLKANVAAASAATMNEQAEGVPFILEELARTYRDTGMIQMIDGAWTLARNAARLVPSSVKTLIQRRSARLPDATRQVLAEAAILGRAFSLKDLRALKLKLGCPEEECTSTALAEALDPAASAGLLEELPESSPADYRFSH
ncbi:MAG: ATP-binding protein [Actinomycetota bacterium]